MNKAIQTLGYASVSTDDQDLSLQREALTKYGCDRIFEEYGSGGKMDRPVWNNLIRARRPGDTIVVWKIDRLGRTLTGVIEAVEQMEREQVNFVTLDGKIDTTTCGRKRRMTRATSSCSTSRGQRVKVSSSERV